MLEALQKPRAHRAFAFNLHLPALLKRKLFFQGFVHFLRNMNLSRLAV